MQSQDSSRNPSHLTDGDQELYENMTDNFLRLFFSNKEVMAVSYMSDDAIWTWGESEAYLVSPKTKSDYLKWVETLPPLLKELR
jgi:hypothetical protein